MPCVARFAASRSARDGSCAGDQDVLAHGALLALGDGAAPVLEEVAQEPLAVLRRRLRGDDGGGEVVQHAVAVGQQRVVLARANDRPRAEACS